MTTFTLQLRVKQSEGALVRVLGVTRRRRFDLLHLTANATEDGNFLDVQMTVKADRANSRPRKSGTRSSRLKNHARRFFLATNH